ncbi:dipeptidase [Muribaculaceae bacterium Isolate-104 (HZI)]|mgnify:FL=1|jgi:dipeptidase|nr:dipeptidase [Muribaculaceae bacterium Isolate-104 (HZI)]
MNFRQLAAAALMAAAPAAALACTSLIAGKKATADGSVIITYAADSHTLYGELYHQPAADHAPGSMRTVTEWDTGKILGQIPEVAHTYRTLGNMNEHGLTIAESTWGGREELAGSGLIDYGSLIYITLQRARTAREALKVMTELVEKYGYASSGESFSIADADEAWIMELIGKGKDDKGAVWVARRVPDDCISGHANHARIHTFPLDDPETLYSPDVISFARSKGYFNGKDKDFSFSRAYAVTDGGALRGCDGRVWSFYNRHSQGAQPYLDWILKGEGAPLPLWVKPEKPVTVRDMQAMMRDHFEGTPLDMTTDIGAGPYAVPYRWRPLTYQVDSVEYTHERAIATQQTGFSFVSQMNSARPRAMKGILWFGVDDANTCVYVPVFNGSTAVPHEFAVGNGDLYNLSWESAFWINNYVANQAYYRYSQMIPDIRRVQNAIEDTFEAEMPDLEKEIAAMNAGDAASRLNDYTASRTTDYTRRYKALGDYLFVKYMDGNVKREKNGEFERTPEGMPEYPMFPGYDERYYRSIAKDPSGGERLKSLIIK